MNTAAPTTPIADNVERPDAERYKAETAVLMKEAEQHRIAYMNAYRSREMSAATFGILAVFIGGCGFGWFLFMHAQVFKAAASIIIAIGVPILLHIWSRGPVNAYLKDYKKSFMPKMAKALGGFNFFPDRGISAKILPKTGVVPQHDDYSGEDCFMGVYKGVKVIFSEARLKRKNKTVFDGIYALLEIPDNVIEGHTIITSDSDLIARSAGRRWKTLGAVDMPEAEDPRFRKFSVFSNQPESAKLLAGEKLLKELYEAGEVFDDAPVTAVFFGKKYIFLSIPYEENMFEPSTIFVPIATPENTMSCKREIEQILEIIDVFDIYRKQG